MRRKFSLRELTVLGYRALVHLILFLLFIYIMGIDNPSLIRPSRTSAVIILMYIITNGLMTVVYGGFDIGIKKSKPIFYAVFTATVFTDIVAYFTLMIMNTNPMNNERFRLDNLQYLLLVMIIQAIIIRLMAHGGNMLFFTMYPPKKTLLVVGKDSTDSARVRAYLSTYKKQYKIQMEVDEGNSNVPKLIENHDLVVFIDVFGQARRELTSFCYRKGIAFAFAPSIIDTIELSGQYLVYDDKPMLEVGTKPMTLSQQVFKRFLDLAVSLLGLILISPILLIVGIAIKIDDGGTVFYRQERLTLHGRKFRIIKFRTMKPNDNKTLATVDDDRITRVGKVLRRMRLDELPQIINILSGDMSVVGPRPEQEYLFREYAKELPEFGYRLKVKAGLTGEAQIAGKYNTSPRDKLLLDLSYIQNYSVWRDIKLIFQTLTVFFKKDSTEGIQEDGKVGVVHSSPETETILKAGEDSVRDEQKS